MKSQVIFRDIQRTEELEKFVLTQTETRINDFFLEPNGPQLKVTVYQDRHRNHRCGKHYVCEIVLHLNDHHQTLKVTKSDSDFYDCVVDAGVALKKRIGRNHKFKVSNRRWQLADITA